MTDTDDNWDTCATNPYVSEYIKPLNEKCSNNQYDWHSVCQETFALILWKLQETYHLDYETSFRLAGDWRHISPGRIGKMFNKNGWDLDDQMPALKEAHPELAEIEKQLPKRNLFRIRPCDEMSSMEGSVYD